MDKKARAAMAKTFADDLEWALAFIDEYGPKMPEDIKPGTHAERYRNARQRLAAWKDQE